MRIANPQETWAEAGQPEWSGSRNLRQDPWPDGSPLAFGLVVLLAPLSALLRRCYYY